MRHLLLSFSLFAFTLPALSAAEPINTYNGVTKPLWEGAAPHAKGTTPADIPELTLHVPPADKKTDSAVIVFPGGGYGHTAITYEGHDVADWFNQRGVTAYVLRYRHSPNYQHPVPMLDAQHAIRIARSRAEELGYNPRKIGVLGFSAGGHLASTVATHFDEGDASSTDVIEQQSSRPDFAVLVYPVVTMQDDFTHQGSRKNLLGTNPDPELIENLSNERQITPETPPTFLVHTNGDTGVAAENSVQFYLALRKVNVPAELHIYEEGRHGLGFGRRPNTPEAFTQWPIALENWLKVHELVEK
ncbi:Acetylxylan esterase precursor [Polystyrenella longa]|uniref:Acetylxylan esterase n=1 Tax=Polystyrenella longa TaxID=2528007 RepID=A0A518CNS9_9PLAN|nr:alpha/beta hydrolase [Polystyrenella longa]QDU80844.1 Acetylxylan esterase precursor [Polystyrenella longa]